VTVRFTDGTIEESYQYAARSILSPLSNDEIVAKYRALTRRVMDAERQARLEELVLSLDTVPDLGTLAGLLAPSVASPFEPAP
jgi:aconitate decarboxylase